MNLFRMADRLAGRMRWYDISMLKTAVILFTLFILAAFPPLASVLLSAAWYWYLAAAVLLSAPLTVKMFRK